MEETNKQVFVSNLNFKQISEKEIDDIIVHAHAPRFSKYYDCFLGGESPKLSGIEQKKQFLVFYELYCIFAGLQNLWGRGRTKKLIESYIDNIKFGLKWLKYGYDDVDEVFFSLKNDSKLWLCFRTPKKSAAEKELAARLKKQCKDIFNLSVFTRNPN